MVLQKLLRLGEGRRLRQLEALAAEVGSREHEVKGLSDAELAGRTDVFRTRLADGETCSTTCCPTPFRGRQGGGMAGAGSAPLRRAGRRWRPPCTPGRSPR